MDDANRAFHDLEQWLAAPLTQTSPLHLVELQQELKGREVQRLLLQSHVNLRGSGDIGPSLRLAHDGSYCLFTHPRLQRRTLKTVFGEIDIDRMAYRCQGKPSIHPLDESLQLPQRSFSYELQKRLIKAALQGPFREATARIRESSGLIVHNHSIEPLLIEAAMDFDDFYGQRAADPVSEAASLLVIAVDCKGIPLVKPEPVRPPRPPLGLMRPLTPGKQRAGKKKMATVAAVFAKAPFLRTPQMIIDNLFPAGAKSTNKQPAPKPERKRVWASLTKTKTVVIEEIRQEVLRRDPDARKTLVALIDGERALQKRTLTAMKPTLILDLIHVLERVWTAAHIFQPQGSAEAEVYAKLMTSRILEGSVCQVVKGLRQTVTKRRLSGSAKKTLLAVANYFHNNTRYMRYHEYLAAGFPIASGPVEGACKNLIKDRMERSGMRWTRDMAEAIVKLRSLYLSGDFDNYWSFHVAQDQLRLYPQDRWTVVAK